MECERIRASALWKSTAAFLRPEPKVIFLEDEHAAGQAQYILHHQPSTGTGCELQDGGNYKVGFGGGEVFSVDDLLDLGDGGVAEDASALAAENVVSCHGGFWGHGKAGSSDSNSGLTSEAGAADAEPLLPVGDITDLEWVSQFVDDSYAYVPPCPVISPPSYAAVVAKSASKHDPHQHRPLQFVPNPTSASASHSRSPSAGSVTSPVAGVCSLSLKRPWSWSSSSPLLEDPLGSSSTAGAGLAAFRKARSKRLRTDSGARAWAFTAETLHQEPLCSSASSSSSCSSTSSSFSSRLLFDHQSSYAASPYHLFPAAPRPRGRPPLHKKYAQQHAALGGDQLMLLLQQRERPLKPKKKKGRKPKLSTSSPFAGGSSSIAAAAAAASGGLGGEVPGDEPGSGTGRRCSHCGVQKTPQWRAGPMGAKTLCNACGVRYKSGRLLPEYRPACSPTFMSHVHSNSHRKVLEMRRNKEMMEQLQPQPQQQEQEQEEGEQPQEHELLSLSASTAAVAAAAAAVAAAPPASPQPVVTAQAMPAQQMVC